MIKRKKEIKEEGENYRKKMWFDFFQGDFAKIRANHTI